MSTVTSPDGATNSMRTVVALPIVAETSDAKKSPDGMCATCVLESLTHALSLCGFALA